MPMWMIMLGYKVGSLGLITLTTMLTNLALIPCWQLYTLVEANFGTMWAVASVPALYVVWGTLFCLEIIVFKKVFFLKEREGEHNLFSFMTGVWAVTNYLIRIADTVFMCHFQGTPFIVLWYRLLGAKIGKNVTINATALGDLDLVEIGDNTVLGAGTTVLAHSVEKNKLIIKGVKIGANCDVGLKASVLPGTVMEDRSILGAHGVTLKNQRLEANTIYGGVPAVARGLRGDGKKKPSLVAVEGEPTDRPTDNGDKVAAHG